MYAPADAQFAVFVSLYPPCVKRLKDAHLTEDPGAYQGFDSPCTALTRVTVGDSDAPRRGCELYEHPAGRIVNRETGLPFTRNDDCLKGVGTLLTTRAHTPRPLKM